MNLASLLSDDFESTVRNRGKIYYWQSRVRIRHGSDREVQASVRGSRTYDVNLDWADGTLSLDCDCEYFDIRRSLQAPLGHGVGRRCQGLPDGGQVRARADTRTSARLTGTATSTWTAMKRTKRSSPFTRGRCRRWWFPSRRPKVPPGWPISAGLPAAPCWWIPPKRGRPSARLSTSWTCQPADRPR